MSSTPPNALKKIKEVSSEYFALRMQKSGLNKNQTELIRKILNGEIYISYPEIWDIERFVLKAIDQDYYNSLSLGDHPYSNNELYEYDPPKNGINIIKHGISFCEVVSYSDKFGTLIVPCPHKDDGDRDVIFSDLNPKKGSPKIHINNENDTKYVLSIAHSRNNKFRFISSRFLSRENYKEQLGQAFKNIYKNDVTAKNAFVDRCAQIIVDNLLSQSLTK